jgi:predicted MPP superfamily phosphohydrolase
MITAGLAALVLAALFAWGVYQARALRLEEKELALPGLPEQMLGRRVLHISDAHLGARWNLLDRILSRARAARADWTFVTGDLTLRKSGLPFAARLLEGLAALNPTWVVPGNAEYAAMRAYEVPPGYDGAARLLRNSAQVLADGDPPCWIVGVDCPHFRRADLGAGFSAVPDGAWTILLAHSPDIILEPGARRARLIFSGHTHGGQVRFPGLPAVYANTRISRRFAQGAHDLGGTVLVVSRGAGVARLPVRFFCPPEITVWRLVRAGQETPPGEERQTSGEMG